MRAWDESVGRLLAACATADADGQTRLVEISATATFPATVAVRIQLLDTVVHTWDVAISLGLDHRPTPEILDLVAATARSIPEGSSRTLPGAAFEPSLAISSSDPWVATLAHLGRRPRP